MIETEHLLLRPFLKSGAKHKLPRRFVRQRKKAATENAVAFGPAGHAD